MKTNDTVWFYNVEFTYFDEESLPCQFKNIKLLVAGTSFEDVIRKINYYYSDECITNISAEIINDTEDGVQVISEDVVIE